MALKLANNIQRALKARREIENMYCNITFVVEKSRKIPETTFVNDDETKFLAIL